MYMRCPMVLYLLVSQRIRRIGPCRQPRLAADGGQRDGEDAHARYHKPPQANVDAIGIERSTLPVVAPNTLRMPISLVRRI